MEGARPRTITVDAFAEATFSAVMRAVDARRASAPAMTTPLPGGLAGLIPGYPVIVYGIIAGPGWPWGGIGVGVAPAAPGGSSAPGE